MQSSVMSIFVLLVVACASSGPARVLCAGRSTALELGDEELAHDPRRCVVIACPRAAVLVGPPRSNSASSSRRACGSPGIRVRRASKCAAGVGVTRLVPSHVVGSSGVGHGRFSLLIPREVP